MSSSHKKIYSNLHSNFFDKIVLKKRFEIISVIKKFLKDVKIENVLDVGSTYDDINPSSNYVIKNLGEYKEYKSISDQKIETTINEFVGKDFSSFKTKLSEKLVETISPIGKNISKLMKDKKHLEDVLKKGNQKASIIAEENLKKIREIVGFV